MLFKYVTNIRIRVRIRRYLLTGIRICIHIRGASGAGIRLRIRTADMRILTSDPSLLTPELCNECCNRSVSYLYPTMSSISAM